ncbi:hypothetical protein O181_031854 [Austropuccinia psidii MF-1]|uniref:Uncharacterized protein n=1 Tax=Austropuccinia psidii MF-1 TaxID=1389203 RepID=A0A9Q3CWH2_9BASI|nr:hypothetical protein [Austropuccinia psidii MF-1]
MQTRDFPASFATTKAALFVHIKILWGLLKQDLVPKPPELSTLQEFYKNFRQAEEVEEAVQSVIHLGDNFIRYAKGLMTRLGLRELAATSAYAYLNINPRMAMDIPLLIQAYNHFVHYLILGRYNKEKKEEGKNAKNAAHKRFSKNRERLRNERRDFSILNKFPKRYQEVLAHIAAHSDDEEVKGKGFYMIKTLSYHSNNANRFFRRLDTVMMKAAYQDPLASKSRHRVRRLPRNPVESEYKVAPRGLPINFYCPKWFKTLSHSQQHTIPNRNKLVFLPNAKDSLLPKGEQHPDEKLADSTFTRKYWEALAEPYGLVEESSSEESEPEPEDQDSEGEEIISTQPSPEKTDDEFFDEGDDGGLYEDEYEFIAEDGNNEEDGEDEEYSNSDTDQVMGGIPEDEEVW